MRITALLLLLLLLSPALSRGQEGKSAPDPTSPDAKFDKTGDGWVDATDWKRMTREERAAYARASVKALGGDPDASLGDGKTRAGQYLEGLQSVYGR